MHIVSIEVERHPVLGSFLFSFDAGAGLKTFNLLIGSNGAGKTQIMDLVYDCIVKGFNPWNDEVHRKLTVILTEAEITELGVTYSDLRFEYNGDRPNNWGAIKVFRVSDDVDVTRELLPKIQNNLVQKVFQKSCRYSPVEINFASKIIDSVKATTLDSDTVKTKSGPNLAEEIGQLLVDIYNQDAQEALLRERTNAGKGVEYEIHEGKYDRFRKAYSRMFVGKTLSEVSPNDNKHNVLFRDESNGTEFGIEGLSSGEKQVVYRVGYLLSNLGNIEGGVVFIDEPELSLHPVWQRKYLTFLKEVFASNGECKIQFIIASHSPYIIQGADFSETHIWQLKREKGTVTYDNVEKKWSVIPWGPTLGEITFQAFGLPTVEFHCDLYGALQSQKAPGEVKEIEKWFVGQGQTKEISWNESGTGTPRTETLMTYVRNKIHHPDNTDRPDFSEKQLEESILRMLTLI